jgi:hypothetical protein
MISIGEDAAAHEFLRDRVLPAIRMVAAGVGLP